MNLYELSTRFQQLLDQEELSDEDRKELDQIYGDAEDACIERGKYIRNRAAELEAVVQERKRMQDRERALIKKIEREEVWLAQHMRDCGLRKITKSPLFSLTVVQNRPSVDDFDKEAIPAEFWREKTTVMRAVDKDAVKQAIDSGVDVPGCRLITKSRVDFK